MAVKSESQNGAQDAGAGPKFQELFQAVMELGRSSGLRWTLDLLAPVASLLILRWAAHNEAEREASASITGNPFAPSLPHALRLPTWQRRDIEAIRRGVEDFRVSHSGDAALARYLSLVVPRAAELFRIDSRVARKALWLLMELPFESDDDRDQVATGYDAFIEKVTVSEGPAGEFTTPLAVSRLMVELAEPRQGERIYDPCFGVGGLLVAAVQRIRMYQVTSSARAPLDVNRLGVFGIERNVNAFSIGLCRILLRGIARPELELGDTLERPLPHNLTVEGFDCILATPPWGSRLNRGYEQYPVPSSSAELLFLQHVMANLRPGGRAVIGLPDGVMFRLGTDRIVRKKLLTEYRVDGVLSLPAGAFKPYSGLKTNLVLFRRGEPRQSIRFMRASTGVDRLLGEDWGPSRPHEVVQALRSGVEAPWLWETPLSVVADRDYQLVADRRTSDELEQRLHSLWDIEPKVKIAVLESQAEVFAGITYARDVTTANSEHPDAGVKLVRVGDIGVREPEPALHLLRERAERIREQLRLRRGDVLVSKDGTLGKVGLVSEGLVGAVPASGLVVLRPREPLLPDFLALLLRSPLYQSWIREHGQGSLIRHLSIRALRQLRIPIPSRSVQVRVLDETGEQGDALEVLLRVASGTSRDSVSAWLEGSATVGRLMPTHELVSNPELLLSRFAVECEETTSILGPERLPLLLPEVRAWVEALHPVAQGLRGIDSVPKGTARLAALEVIRPRLEEARRVLGESTASLARRARALTSGVLRVLDQQVRELLGPVAVALRLEPTEVMIATATEATVSLRNISHAALRDVSVEALPSYGGGRVPYLAEGDTAEFPIVLKPIELGSLAIPVQWSVRRLDGQPISGEVQLSALVVPNLEAGPDRDLGASPYVVGNPVERDEMFFGREAILERIDRQLGTHSTANIILLEGNRRMGKTSILKQLKKKGRLPGWIPVYCSFQSADGDDQCAGIATRDIYRLIARTIGWELYRAGVETWFPGLSRPTTRPFKPAFLDALDQAFGGDHPFEALELYLEQAIEAARPRRILLMIDEFDKLQEGIENKITSPQVPENIRHILQHHAECSAIITGSYRLKRLREEYWSALFGLGYRIPVSALPLEAARQLVTQPVEGRLVYLPQARDQVVELCARQPFLIQALCNRVFEQAAQGGARIITPEIVQASALEMIDKNEHFQTLWDYAGTSRRRLILALCQRLSKDVDPVALPLLELKLRELEVPLEKPTSLGDDVEFLRELEIIEFDASYRGGTYRIVIPLMAEWVRSNVDFNDLVQRAKQQSMDAQQ